MIHDDVTMKEKKEILENDRKVRGTYHSLASAEAENELGGRFSAAVTRTKVVGSSPIAYPQQPPNSYWAKDLPPEPALGYSVETMETVGEPFEVAKSIQSSPIPAGIGEVAPTLSSSGDAGSVGVKPKKSWRRI